MSNKVKTTYLSEHRVRFPVPINSKIKTHDFLLACTNFVQFIDLFGKIFAPASYDMSGNIKKIMVRYQEDCDKYQYLEDLLFAEQIEGNQIATDALMWLRRGLHFLIEFFERLCYDESKREDLSNFIREAYSDSLKKYHGFIGRNIFNLLVGLTPNRTSLLRSVALGVENCEEAVINDIKAFIPNLKTCVQHLENFYIVNGLESEKIV